jgi:hypothetical protein
MTPLATRPGPPSSSLAKMKIGSPSATCLPPYIVFCARNASTSSALIANALPMSNSAESGRCLAL